MTQIFHVSTRHHPMWGGPKRYIRIYLYIDDEELRKAANKHHYNTKDADPQRAVGMFSPAPRRDVYNRTTDEWETKTDPHWGGCMRLAMTHLTHEVVAHECFHAACAIYRMDIKTQINLAHGCFEREEQLAYLTGQITDDVMWVLRPHLF